MERIYKGKTKDVYRLNNDQVILHFKDDVTGEDGIFDPGANTVGLAIPGAGKSGLRMTAHFFHLIEEQGIPTHYIDIDVDKATMTAKNAEMFGDGVEVICRYKAVGSFYRRYGGYCEEGQHLDAFVEMTLKDDERQDPPISADALEMLGIVTIKEYEKMKDWTKKVAAIVKKEFLAKGCELHDIKLEFGRDKATGDLLLIDEISAGNMRVYKEGEIVAPMDLVEILFRH